MGSHRVLAGRAASRILAAVLSITACRRATTVDAAADARVTGAVRFVAPTDVGAVTEARRIVAWTPDIAETLLALGARERLVGVPSMMAARPEIEGVARVGTQVSPREDVLAGLHPDLLVVVGGPMGQALVEHRPEGAGVETVSFEDRAAYARTVTRLAQRIGRPAAGTELLARINGELAAVQRATQSGPRPRVVALLSREPMVVAGPGSFLDELLDIAGGQNAVANTNHFPVVGVEMIVGWNADVLLDLTGRTEGLETLLPGVRARRVVLSPDGMLRPGPRVGEAARRLSAALHGSRR